jgi:hypothetical protein
MAVGREELQLFLDSDPSVRAARAIDAAIDRIGATAGAVARQFDDRFGDAFSRVRRRASEVAAALKRNFADLGKSLFPNLSQVFSVSIGTLIGNLVSSAVQGVTGAIDRALDAARSFVVRAVDEAKEAAGAQLYLASAVREVGGNFESAAAQARDFARDVGIAEKFGNKLFAQAGLQLAQAGSQFSVDEYVRAFADAAAARGRSLEELPELIGGLFTDDATSDKILGKNPSGVYEEYAAAVGKSAASLSEMEKKQALVNAVVAVGAGNVGGAAARLQNFGGLVEQTSALITDLFAKVGENIGRLRGVRQFVEGIRDSVLNLLDDDGAFDTFFRNAVKAIQGVLRAIIPTVAQIARLVVDVLRWLGGSDVWSDLQLNTLLFFQLVESGIDKVKALALEALAEIMRYVGTGVAANGGPGLRALLGDGTGVAKFLEEAAAGVRADSARRQEERRASIKALMAETSAANQPFVVLEQTINSLEGRVLSAVDALDQIDAPVKKIDAVADATARARFQFSNLKRQIEESVEAAGKLTGQRFDALSDLAGVRNFREALESPLSSRKATNAERVRMAFEEIYTPQLRDLEGPASEIEARMSESFSAAAGAFGSVVASFEAERKAAERNPARDRALRELDEKIFDQIKGFSPMEILRSGYRDQALAVVRRVEQRKEREERELRQKQLETIGTAGENTKKLNALWTEVQKSGLTLPEIAVALKKFAKEGISVENRINVHADTDLSVSVADGEAGDRITRD